MGKAPLPVQVQEKLGIAYPPFTYPGGFQNATMWLGPTGSFTPLHSDARDNFIVQLIGNKHFWLFPPHDRPLLYTTGNLLQWCAVDVRKPDYKKHPLFAQAHGNDVVLKPGETLFLPAGWFHAIHNDSPSLMINYWRRESLPEFVDHQERIAASIVRRRAALLHGQSDSNALPLLSADANAGALATLSTEPAAQDAQQQQQQQSQDDY